MTATIKFTGEFFVPGQSEARIEADHMERYRFAGRFARGKSILDVACGVGYAAPLLIGAGALTYQGVDINPEAVTYAMHTYGGDGIRFAVGDIATFRPGRTYDLITCFETIEHVEDFHAALQNLYDLLNPRGHLLISSPNRAITSPAARSLTDKPRNRYHRQEFIPAELVAELHRVGWVTDRDSLYGQRQRRVHASAGMRRLARLVMGNPDRKASAVVTPLTDKTPRYFIVRAQKP